MLGFFIGACLSDCSQAYLNAPQDGLLTTRFPQGYGLPNPNIALKFRAI